MARYNRGRQRWLKETLAAASIFPPSLMSPLFFPLSSLLLLCLFVAVSSGWRWQCQQRSGGVLWRWRGSTVAVAVVLLIWYIFFFSITSLSLHCFFLSKKPCSFSPSVSPLFLSKKTVGLSLSVSLTFSFKKSFLLSSFFSSPCSCTPSVFIGRGREGHPALSCHGAGHGGMGATVQ